MRIISDFDGVLTTQYAEAAAVGERQVELLGEALGDEAAARTLLDGLRVEVRGDPASYGWPADEGVSCYADEDPYVFHVAVAALLFDRASDEVRDALAGVGAPSREAFAVRCFYEGTERWRARGEAHVLPDALEALQVFANAGIEVVIVSGSSTPRIRAILAEVGLGRFGAWKPRIRGDAGKFLTTEGELPEAPPAIELGGRSLRVRRARYFDILHEEQPDAVIGDVVSLDLALPIGLRGVYPWADDLPLFLKRSEHTPAWAVAGAAEHGVRVIDSLLDVVRWCRA